MKLKSTSIALLGAGWMLSSAFAFTTVDNASKAAVSKPQAPASASDTGASKPTTGHEKNTQTSKPAAPGKGGK